MPNINFTTYKDFGYENSWMVTPSKVKLCRELNHDTVEVDKSQFPNRGTDVLTVCTQCKIVYHTDSSD